MDVFTENMVKSMTICWININCLKRVAVTGMIVDFIEWRVVRGLARTVLRGPGFQLLSQFHRLLPIRLLPTLLDLGLAHSNRVLTPRRHVSWHRESLYRVTTLIFIYNLRTLQNINAIAKPREDSAICEWRPNVTAMSKQTADISATFSKVVTCRLFNPLKN